MKDNLARIQFDVEKDLRDRLARKVNWGELRIIYETITKDLVHLLETNDPRMVIAAIVSDEINLKDYIRKNRDADNKQSKEVDNRTGDLFDDAGNPKDQG